MAMTKKEKAELERLQNELEIAKAFRRTEEVLPDVQPPGTWGGLSQGWHFNCHAEKVSIACSSSTSHAIGRNDKTQSQNPIKLYSTRLLALKAMRYSMECDFAKKLAKVDSEIAKEKQSE